MVICDPLPNSEPRQRKQAQDACTQDMHKLSADRSYLTLLDLELFAIAWKQGAEWSVHSEHSVLSELPQDSWVYFSGPLKGFSKLDASKLKRVGYA
jgi:hypothetical protein